MRLLYIQTSPNKEKSISREVADYLVSKLNVASTKILDLESHPLPHINSMALSAFATPPENHSPEQKAAIKLSDEKIEEILTSDILVISTPMWNFGAPSVLKAWFDHISRPGKTFKYTSEGLEGLLGGRKVYVVLSSGSVFSEGPYAGMDQLGPWIRTTFNFLGISDLEIVRVEGTNTSEAAATAIAKAKARVDQLVLNHTLKEEGHV